MLFFTSLLLRDDQLLPVFLLSRCVCSVAVRKAASRTRVRCAVHTRRVSDSDALRNCDFLSRPLGAHTRPRRSPCAQTRLSGSQFTAPRVRLCGHERCMHATELVTCARVYVLQKIYIYIFILLTSLKYILFESAWRSHVHMLTHSLLCKLESRASSGKFSLLRLRKEVSVRAPQRPKLPCAPPSPSEARSHLHK